MRVLDLLLRRDLRELGVVEAWIKMIQAMTARHELLATDHYLFPNVWTHAENVTDRCPICFEDPRDPVLLACGRHAFCRDCITVWLRTQPTCPLCRLDYIQDLENIILPDPEELVRLMEVDIPGVVDNVADRFLHAAMWYYETCNLALLETKRYMLHFREVVSGEIFGRFRKSVTWYQISYHKDVPNSTRLVNRGIESISRFSARRLRQLLQDEEAQLLEERDLIQEKIYKRYLKRDCLF